MWTKILASLFFCLSLLGCSKDHPAPSIPRFHGDLPGAEDVSAQAQRRDELLTRTYEQNIDADGQVANRRSDGTWDDQGDAALWSWITVAASSCDDPRGLVLFNRLLAAIDNNAGLLPNHDPIIDPNHVTSRDMVSGAMFGMVKRWRTCPNDHDAIRAAWAKHVAYVDGPGGGNLSTDAHGLMLTLRWLWGAVGQYFGAGGGGGSKPQFEAGIVTTATSINAAHSACYPLHVTTLNLVTASWIGKPISVTTRSLFCDATRGTRLPYTEWYCERAKAQPWLAAFTPDVWGNADQRCPSWEDPDAHGEQTSPTDFFEIFVSAEQGQG